jgi:uncharacterized protein YukE
MGLFGDIEQTVGDVVHVGEDVAGDVVQAGEAAVGEVAGLLGSLHSFLTDAGLGNVVQELAQLAEEANQVKQKLAAAAGAAEWSGTAADGFHTREQQRQQQLTALVGALDAAHTAVALAYSIAGIFI